jgi:GTP-binding protein
VLSILDRAAVNYQLVLTKGDQITAADQAPLTAAIETAIAHHPAAYPQCLFTSARTGAGIPELRAAIARLLAERTLRRVADERRRS